MPLILHDDKNPSDCSTEPHDITHICDALRYFCVTRTLGAERIETQMEDDFDSGEDYDDAMTGGEASDDYISFGGG